MAGSLTIAFDEQALRRAGEHAVSLIVKRTLKGRDREGDPFASYSRKPFAMPAGGGSARARNRLERDGALKYFTAQSSGRLWMVIEGGYAAWKEARYNQDGGRVNLSATGAMLRALRLTRVRGGEKPEVVIGFLRAEEAEKAYWHTVEGAGKAKTLRDFRGLTAEETREVKRIVASDAITIKT